MITKCKVCGEMVHTGNNYHESCIYCNSLCQVEFQNSESHVDGLRVKGEMYLKANNYVEALKIFDKAIDIHPNVAELYWGRMLARNLCSNDLQLLRKGVNLYNDPDYVVAVHLAEQDEKECYKKIGSIYKSLVTVLNDKLNQLEIQEKKATNIADKQKQADKKILEFRDCLFKSISKLDAVEKKLRDIAVDCNVVLDSEKTRIGVWVGEVEVARNEVRQKKEVTLEAYNSYQNLIKKHLDLCNNELSLMQNKSNISFMTEYSKLKSEQLQAEQEVNSIIDKINKINDELAGMINSISRITKKYDVARNEVSDRDFSKAVSIMGENVFSSILQNYIKGVI